MLVVSLVAVIAAGIGVVLGVVVVGGDADPGPTTALDSALDTSSERDDSFGEAEAEPDQAPTEDAGSAASGTGQATAGDDGEQDLPANIDEPADAADIDDGPADTRMDTREVAPDDQNADQPAEPLVAQELTETFGTFIADWDSGDIDRAYAHISPSLRQQSGWGYEQFASFRRETIVGCAVVSVDVVSDDRLEVDGTVDFYLPDGRVSREQLRVSFTRDPGGGLLVATYDVLSTESRG